MRFTRRIPGIRPPIPSREDEAAPGFEPFSPGWISALVFVFLLSLLGIFLLCTLKLGGEMAVFWLETEVLGLSLYAIASAINVMLLLLVLASFVLSGRMRRSRRDWKRPMGVFFAIGILGCTQVYLNGWKEQAKLDRDRSQVEASEEEPSRGDAGYSPSTGGSSCAYFRNHPRT